MLGHNPPRVSICLRTADPRTVSAVYAELNFTMLKTRPGQESVAAGDFAGGAGSASSILLPTLLELSVAKSNI